jgi:mediator of RNA polymerase II transcription subunit 16, fungi type
MCDPHTGRWDISPAYSHPRITATHEGQQLVHITWNMLGAELAVIDVHGRVSIHCVVSAINDMSCVREANRDQEEDMNAIVGFGWLNLDRPVCKKNLG